MPGQSAEQCRKSSVSRGDYLGSALKANVPEMQREWISYGRRSKTSPAMLLYTPIGDMMARTRIDTEEQAKAIRDKLRKELVKKCWSEVTASGYSGIPYHTLSFMVNNSRFEQLVTAGMLARALGVSLDWLVGLTDVKEVQKR